MKRLIMMMLVLAAGCGRVQPPDDEANRRPAQVVSASGRVTGAGIRADVQLGATFVRAP